MSDFTTTTNLSLKKPAIGGSSDKWGEYLNENMETIGTSIVNLQNASTSRSLESLSNVLDTTPTTGQLLQYDTANWQAATVTIPDNIQDLTNVTISSPADGQVLAWSNSNSRWENQTPGAATIPDGTITNAKLSTSLQGQVALILQTTGTPTDNQILRYDSTSTNWQFEDLPGGTVAALSDTDVSAIANKDVLVYNSTSGNWVSRPLAISDITNLQTSLDAKLESSDINVSALSDTTITSTVDDSFLVYDSSDSKWKNEGPSTVRTTLDLVVGTNVQAQNSNLDDLSGISFTAKANQAIVINGTADGLTTAHRNVGALTSVTISGDDEFSILKTVASGSTGDSNTFSLSLNAANTRTHLGLGALATQDTITESQITDLQSYLTAETNDLSTAVTGTLGTGNGGTGLTAIGTANQVLAVNATATALEYQTLSTGGTVTSVSVSGSDGIEVDSGSPITSSGTIALGINATSLSTHLGLGTAATTAATDYATAAQGATADTALQDIEHVNSVTTAETISSGNHRFYVGPVSFSNTVTIAGKLLVFDGILNTTGTINTTGTLNVRG